MAKGDLILRLKTQGIARGQKQIKATNTQLRRMGINARASAKSVGGLGRSFSVLSRFIAPAALFAGLTLATRKAVREFASFDHAMREVFTVTNLTSKAFQAFKSQTADLAASLGTNRVETAGAAYEIFSRLTKNAGLALKFTAIASKAAVGGLTNSRESAKLLAGQMRSFAQQSLSASEA